MQWTMQAKLNAVNDTSNTLKNDAKTLLISLNDFYDTMQDIMMQNKHGSLMKPSALIKHLMLHVVR